MDKTHPGTLNCHQGRNGQGLKSPPPDLATLPFSPWSSAHRKGGQGRGCGHSEAVGSRGLHTVPIQTSPQDPKENPPTAHPLAGPRRPLLKAPKQVASYPDEPSFLGEARGEGAAECTSKRGWLPRSRRRSCSSAGHLAGVTGMADKHRS